MAQPFAQPRAPALAPLRARTRALSLLLALASALSFSSTSLLAVVVGDGVLCPSAAVACSRAAPLALNEYNLATGALVSSTRIAGATLSATDQYVGALSRSADGTCVVFGANAAPSATAASANAIARVQPGPYFPGNVVVVKVGANGVPDTTTQLSSAAYNGIIKGACTFDGSGFWLAGNASNTCVGYVAYGLSAFVNVAHDASCTTPDGVMNSFYTGCQAAANPNQIYLTRNWAQFGFVDIPTPNLLSAAWTTDGGMNLNSEAGGWTSTNTLQFNFPYSFTQVITNRAQSQFWAIEPFLCGIAYGSGYATLPWLTSPPWGFLLDGTGGSASPCPISGLTLSPDETRLFFSAHASIYWMYSTPAANFDEAMGNTYSGVNVGTGGLGVNWWLLATLPAPFYEFRGIALAPATCSSAGFYCPGGVLPAAMCPPGSYCPGGAAQVPVPCAGGAYCPLGSSGDSTTAFACPPGSFCPAGSGPILCAPNTFSSASNAASCSACPAGVGSVSGLLSGQAACACAPGYVWASPSAASCTLCAAGAWSYGSATASGYAVSTCAASCPSGTVFVSSSLGCAPTSSADGPVDSLAFAFSGSLAEGIAAFAPSSNVTGVSYTMDRFGLVGAALSLPFGAHLDTSTSMPASLPTGGAAMSLSAFVRCAPFSATPQATVFEWGLPAVASSTLKLSLSVLGSGNASVPGPIAGVCDSKWHHLAIVQGDGSASALKQYVDGALIASSSSSAAGNVTSLGSSLRIGWNGAPAQASSDDLFSGSVSDLRLYSRALLVSEVLALSQPPLVYAGAANPAPSSTATSYSWTQCAAGFSGVAAQNWTKDAASNMWSLSGAGINCTCTGAPCLFFCGPGTYSYGGTIACAPCPPSTAFVSSTQGCDPLLASGVGDSGVGFALSGSSAEGVAGFATVAAPAGLSYTANKLGAASSALVLAAGTYLSSANYTAAPSYLPSGNGPMSATAWVKCSALPVGGQASFLEWGAAGPAGSVTTLSLLVGAVGGRLGFPTVTDTTAAGNIDHFWPLGLTLDPGRNLYMADEGHNRVRFATPAGVVSTVAGGGAAGDTAGFLNAIGTSA